MVSINSITTSLKQHKHIILGGLFALILIGLFTLTLKAQWVVDTIHINQSSEQYELFKALGLKGEQFKPMALPPVEPNRLDILVLGIRGIGEEFGGLLTDTILLLSLNKENGQASMISIPRDLFITLPYNGSVKINEVYGLGFDEGGESLAFHLVKTVLSQISGIYIDGVIRVDFQGFKKLIDSVEGVDIYLDKPFVEIAQWEGKGGFTLPGGWNHLNGEQTLFFIRSRFATSDFDRSRRQQEILLALKNKMISIGFLSNPLKIYNVLDIIGSHVKTDLTLDISQAITLSNTIDYRNIKRLLLTTQNYLYQGTAPSGAYILLPKEGNFNEIQYVIKNIFTLDEREYNRVINNHYPLPNATATPASLKEIGE